LATPRIIVADCGPLLTYLALLYVDKNNAPRAKRERIFSEVRQGAIFGDAEQSLLKAVMNQVLTTPHVLAETFKLRKLSMLRKEAEAFRRFSLEILAIGRIKEVPCPIDELTGDDDFRRLVCRLGVTDAGLVYVAAKQRALLLTDDKPLSNDYSAGAGAGYQIRLLNDYFQEQLYVTATPPY
jgi:hypothetical protein